MGKKNKQPLANAKVGVVGAGAWGTALAMVANRAGSDAVLWSRNENVLESVQANRVNEVYLPDIFLDPDIVITDQISDLTHCDCIILSISSQSVRAMAITLSDIIPSTMPLVLACKGIERGSLSLMHEVLESILPNNPVAVLSGPNFAREVAEGLPAATVIASDDRALGERIGYMLGGTYFRPYISTDVSGTEIGGAVKNVVAIAAGVCEGRSMGSNACAAVITRGMQEIQRLAEVKGGKPETIVGLAGMGDLLLTCSSTQSRNMSLGISLARSVVEGDKAQNQMRHGLTEGVATAESVYHMSRKLGVSMPICTTVYQLVSGHMGVDEAIESLLSRPFTSE